MVSAFTLGGAFACSGNTTPSSQIMLALQSDMSLPKDVNKVRIQILENGNFKFDHSYDVGGPNDEKIPATLAVAGDPGTSVEVRVLGFRGSEARTLNKVITTIPDQRIALLRVPIQWLCEGYVRDVGLDTYETTCSGDNACIGGECKPVAQNSQSMPDYSPAAVFGGSTRQGGNGKCFSTETCMDSGFDVQPNMSDCSVDVMAGAAQLNFAVRTPMGGDGICSSNNCYVPLDKSDEFGWRDETTGGTGDTVDAGSGEGGATSVRDGGIGATSTGTDAGTAPSGDAATAGSAGSGYDAGYGGSGGNGGDTGAFGGSFSPGGTGSDFANFQPPHLQPQQAEQQAMHHVKLPKGVCDRIGDGRALGLRATTTCDTKTADIPTCGPWSSVGGALPGAEVDGGGPAVDGCSEFVPGAIFAAVTGEPLVDAYLQTAADLSESASQLRSAAATSCQNILTAMGVPFPIEEPPTDDQVFKACDEASRLLDEMGGSYAVNVHPARCWSEIERQETCEATCPGSVCVTPADQRCDALVGTCQGSCYGTCYSNGSPITCEGACSGVCNGTCSGGCSQEDSYGNCTGVCSGACFGTCDGACAATGSYCGGICEGDTMLGGIACEGPFVGTSDCRLPLNPDQCVDQVCALTCAGDVGIHQMCGITQANVVPLQTGNEVVNAPSEVVNAVNMNFGPLTDVAVKSEGLAQAATYVTLAGQGLEKSGLSAKGSSCVTVATSAVYDASSSITNSSNAAYNLLMGAGGSAGSVSTGGSGTGGGGGTGPVVPCIGPGLTALIEDFSDSDVVLLPNDGRKGAWYTAAHPSGYINTWGVEYHAVYGYAFHFTSMNTGGWGALGAVDLNNGDCFDASNWGGLSLWVMSAATYSTAIVRVTTTESLADGTCAASNGPSCAFYTVADASSSGNTWNFPWAAFSFDGDIPAPVFDPSHIVSIEIGEPTANADLWFDNLTFFNP